MTKIPTDEALYRAYCQHHAIEDSLRAVATLAAEQAVKEAVQRIDKWARGVGYPYVAVNDYGLEQMLRRDFPSAFTPTPPKEQPVQPISEKVKQAQMAAQLEMGRGKRCGDDGPPLVPTKPSPDPATVRLCIEALREVKGDGSYLPGAERAAALLESLLPTPAPEPERYVTLREVEAVLRSGMPTDTPGRIAAEAGLGQILGRLGSAAKHALFTEQQVREAVARKVGGLAYIDKELIDDIVSTLRAGSALRLAAKQGGGA